MLFFSLALVAGILFLVGQQGMKRSFSKVVMQVLQATGLLLPAAALGAATTCLMGNWAHVLNTTWFGYVVCLGITVAVVSGVLFLRKAIWPAVQSSVDGDAAVSKWFPTTVASLICLGLLVTFAAGIFLAPNNWDSMTYHLSRIIQWQQNGHLWHYPTPDDRHLYQPPLTEWVLLAGKLADQDSDRGLFLLQWWAYVGVLGLTSILGSQLGLKGRNLWALIGLVAATPMAVLQASSTQNDLLLAFWLLLASVSVYLGMVVPSRHTSQDREHRHWQVLAGLGAVGALLTKGTASIFLLALVVAALISLPWRQWLLLAWRPVVVALAALLMLGTQFYYDNWQHTGSLLGVTDKTRQVYQVQQPTPALIGANAIMNLSMQLSLPGADDALTKGWSAVVETLTGTNPNDRRLIFGDQPFRIANTTHEDTATGIFQALFAIAGIVVLVRLAVKQGLGIVWRKPTDQVMRFWLVQLMVAGLLFITLFRWQPWHGRLHLSFLLVAAIPMQALAIQQIMGRGKRIGVEVFLVIIAATVVWFGLKNDRRQLGRPQHWEAKGMEGYYAADRGDLLPDHKAIVKATAIHHLKAIALIRQGDGWDYPLAQDLRTSLGKPLVYLNYRSDLKPSLLNAQRFLPTMKDTVGILLELGKQQTDTLHLNHFPKCYSSNNYYLVRATWEQATALPNMPPN